MPEDIISPELLGHYVAWATYPNGTQESFLGLPGEGKKRFLAKSGTEAACAAKAEFMMNRPDIGNLIAGLVLPETLTVVHLASLAPEIYAFDEIAHKAHDLRGHYAAWAFLETGQARTFTEGEVAKRFAADCPLSAAAEAKTDFLAQRATTWAWPMEIIVVDLVTMESEHFEFDDVPAAKSAA
jgi:hypothetical protein